MKILMVAHMNPESVDYPVFLANQWRTLGHAIENFSVELELFDDPWVQFLGLAPDCVLEQRIDRACERFAPDIILLMNNFLTARRVLRLKNRHRCAVGCYLDNNYLLEREAAQILSLSDFVIVHDSYVIPLIKGENGGRVRNVFYLPGVAEPSEHLPLALSEEDRQRYGPNIAFIGKKGPTRIAAFRRIASRGLRIWGLAQEWKSHTEFASLVEAEPVYGLRKTKIYNAAKIVLNLDEGTKQVNSLNPRIPEVLACGGFVLTNWTKDLEEVGFRDGENVAWFRSLEEMEYKIDHYLADADRRREISQKGREHVLRNLTYESVAPGLATAIASVLH